MENYLEQVAKKAGNERAAMKNGASAENSATDLHQSVGETICVQCVLQ
jgi:hypothetical protein